MKKVRLFVMALALSLSSLAVLASPHSWAATRTWTGGSDTNMNTAANWGGTAPSAGDDLVFPANITNRTVVNNYSAATSFNSITFSGTASSASNYTISGNSITLAGNLTISMTGSGASYQTLSTPIIVGGAPSTITVPSTSSLYLSGAISGSGGFTKAGTGDVVLSGSNATYSGAITVSAGILAVGTTDGLGTTAGATTVASGASLVLYGFSSDTTFAEPLTISGNGTTYIGALSVSGGYGSGGVGSSPYPTATFSGALTLGSNIKVGAGDRNVKFTGSCSGNYTITQFDGSTGTIEMAASPNGCATANGVQDVPTKTTEYNTDMTGTPITVNKNETAIVKGTVGDVTISNGGTLKGTGTVGAINAFIGSTIAPGLSPGCLNTGNLNLNDGSTYQVELGGADACSGYDQLKVTGSVGITNVKLNASIVSSYKPALNSKYVIVSNDGTDAISGTFSGLAEGATFTVSGYVFKISYVGGDGNDITLTVQTVPAAPNTGFAMLTRNPLAAMSAVFTAAIAVALIARRMVKAPVRSRR